MFFTFHYGAFSCTGTDLKKFARNIVLLDGIVRQVKNYNWAIQFSWTQDGATRPLTELQRERLDYLLREHGIEYFSQS